MLIKNNRNTIHGYRFTQEELWEIGIQIPFLIFYLTREQPRPTANNLVRLRFGTLNIGTLTGRSRELSDALKRRRIDFVCVQEVKWTGGKAVMDVHFLLKTPWAYN